MKKRIFISFIAAVIVGLLAFAFAPGLQESLASLGAVGGGGCTTTVEGATTAGSVALTCRRAVVFYTEKTCTGKCGFHPALPAFAQADLDKLPGLQLVSFVYVRMMDDSKKPVDQPVTVCFTERAFDKVVNPKIYTYHPRDGWVQYFNDFDYQNNLLCTSYVGEASFALLGTPKP